MSENQLTFDKIKALIEMEDVEQREQIIDNIVTKYIDQLDIVLGQISSENNPVKVLAFAKNFYKTSLKELLWIFVFAAKPKHRARMAVIFNRVQELLDKYKMG